VSTEQFSRFFAVLSLLTWAGTLVGLAILVGRRRWSWAARSASELGAAALWLGALVAAVCTAGSLYYSEVAHFVPCELCWFQRICMYPLTATLAVAAALGDRRAWRYVVIPATVGAVIAAYHTQLQAFPEQSTFCPTTVPCNIRHVWEFGFVSLPFMSLAGFVFILVALRLAVVGGRTDARPQEVPS
jgi:disulfide bond formation protein DsbB